MATAVLVNRPVQPAELDLVVGDEVPCCLPVAPGGVFAEAQHVPLRLQGDALFPGVAERLVNVSSYQDGGDDKKGDGEGNPGFRSYHGSVNGFWGQSCFAICCAA